MYQFDWQVFEDEEYSHDSENSFVKLNERNYITASGTAKDKTSDKEFLALADALSTIAAKISEGPDGGVNIPGFRTYRPYPLQAMWSGGNLEERTNFQLWIKQPNMVPEEFFHAAIEQLNLDAKLLARIKYVRMAEGTEIQSYTDGNIADTIYKLESEVYASELTQLSQTEHREVYVDGYGKGKPALVRIPIKVGEEKIDRNRLSTN